MQYRRSYIKHASYFFTINLNDRRQRYFVEHIDALREAFQHVHARHPFQMDAVVILPDHIHAIWTMTDDPDYSLRWALIKSHFSRGLDVNETTTPSRKRRGERGIWQRRFWEHQIRDEKDFERHVDYIHYNPVKHGYVSSVCEWPYSSFHKYVKNGLLPVNWGGVDVHVDGAFGE